MACSQPPSAPLIDIFLVSFKPPARSTYRQRFDAATEAMARNLSDDQRFGSVIGRIASVEAKIVDDGLVFVKKFAFGTGGEA